MQQFLQVTLHCMQPAMAPIGKDSAGAVAVLATTVEPDELAPHVDQLAGNHSIT
jgi:hypothetical protein